MLRSIMLQSRRMATQKLTPSPTTASVAVVLADIPERRRLREVAAELEARRDQIAELDLEIEQLRDELSAFEQLYQGKMAHENQELSRIERLVAHFDRWMDLLREAPRRKVVKQAKKVEARRAREIQERRAEEEARAARESEEVEAEARPPPDERLKSAYRALARRFHPDLARTEEERVAYGDMMAKINALYKAGDLERLAALAEQAKGGEIDDLEVSLDEQLHKLEERLAWFDVVLENLKDERASLERSPTCELMRNVQQADAAGRDLLDEIREELQGRVDRAYQQVRKAALALEQSVARFNREQQKTSVEAPKKKGERGLRVFDPFGDKKLVRLGLEELATLHLSPAAHREADRLVQLGETEPAVLRLVLFTYVSELSPYPLPGLERYEDLALRFSHLGEEDGVTLERALVLADELVEFGVKKASEKVAHMGLRFRSALVREAAPLLLKSLGIRRELKRVLSVLGERATCPACEELVFSVPLFKTRGLDDLRANVCPRCGHTIHSYWMPKGKDVQAVLNPAFLDFELVTEWSFSLSRGTFAMQLLPSQVDEMRVGDLAKRLHADVFARYELPVSASQVKLAEKKTALAPKLPLADVALRKLSVRFTDDVEISEAEALEMLRHRVRTRFTR